MLAVVGFGLLLVVLLGAGSGALLVFVERRRQFYEAEYRSRLAREDQERQERIDRIQRGL